MTRLSTQVSRHCTGCQEEQPFEPFHAGACPDGPDGDCQEWACTACGGALFVGLPVSGGRAARATRAA